MIFLGLGFDVDDIVLTMEVPYPFRSRCILFYSFRYPISCSGRNVIIFNDVFVVFPYLHSPDGLP